MNHVLRTWSWIAILPILSISPLAAQENYDAEERAFAAKLKPASDKIQKEIQAFQTETREAFNNGKFDELETKATELRATKAVFGNGSWKILRFHDSFPCGDDDPRAAWKNRHRLYLDWIAAKPESVTPRVAYAYFLVEESWWARGPGFADTVSDEGARRFADGHTAARKILEEARLLKEKDPVWWLVALKIARGQGWALKNYDAMLANAVAFEPKFWGYDIERAFSLLPRWYGQPGDWVTYAEKAAARPGGLDAEVYARIVIQHRPFYDNVFQDGGASWPKTREGLELMRKKYPESMEVVSNTAILAAGQDRELANEMFDLLGELYLPEIWRKPERFAHYRNWARTGNW